MFNVCAILPVKYQANNIIVRRAKSEDVVPIKLRGMQKIHHNPPKRTEILLSL